MKSSFKLMNFVIYESYLFPQIFTISFYIYNIFWNMFWNQQMASVVWKSEETFWRGSDRIETADTMHNVIIPSGRVQNRQEISRSQPCRFWFNKKEVRHIMRSRNWRTKIRLDTLGHSDMFGWTLCRKSFFPNLIMINIWPAGWQPFFP